MTKLESIFNMIEKLHHVYNANRKEQNDNDRNFCEYVLNELNMQFDVLDDIFKAELKDMVSEVNLSFRVIFKD